VGRLAHPRRARRALGDVERALLVQVELARAPEAAADQGAAGDPGPGRERGRRRHRRRLRVVFKMESHNHPSYIEPYQGAATGVGGILRDVFTMGARPIASSTRCASAGPSTRAPRPPARRGRGHRGYGNAIGVPTVGGEVQFDAATTATSSSTPSPSASCRTDRSSTGRASGRGQPVLYVGAKHRARRHPRRHHGERRVRGQRRASAPPCRWATPSWRSCSSRRASRSSPRRPARRHPGHGRRGAHLERRRDGGARGQRRRARPRPHPAPRARLTPYEMLLSESQERMLMVARPARGAARARHLREVGPRLGRRGQGDRLGPLRVHRDRGLRSLSLAGRSAARQREPPGGGRHPHRRAGRRRAPVRSPLSRRPSPSASWGPCRISAPSISAASCSL
jgi:hypothetical protein